MKAGIYNLRPHNKFSIKQVIYVLENCADMSNNEIAEKTGLKANQVRGIYRRYGFIKEIALDSKNQQGQFRKGKTPWNKGKNGYMGANKTSFKKGSVPKNTVPVGTITIRQQKNEPQPRKRIKVAEPNKWEPYSRFVWKMNFGDIPDGNIIRHKDGMQLNDDPENLESLTRAQHLVRTREKRILTMF